MPHSKTRTPNHQSRKRFQLSSQFIKRLSSYLVLSTTLTLGISYAANSYQWDSDANAGNNNAATQAGLGGPGAWDTTTARWWDGTGTDVAWNNATFDTAVFGGLVGGSVAVTAPVVAGGLKFNTGGYVIAPTSGNTLTLETASGNPAPVVTANASAKIGVSGGSGLMVTQGMTKNGGGT